MKRKALLAITNCTPKKFETYSARGPLPFAIQNRNWSDYTIENGFTLKVLMNAAEQTSLKNATTLARSALDALKPLNPFAYSGDEELWVALVHYDWPDAPEDWNPYLVVAGRWEDIAEQAAAQVKYICDSAKISGILSLSATEIATTLLVEAKEFGLPEGEVQSVPEDLTGYPEWFKEREMKRRELLASF